MGGEDYLGSIGYYFWLIPSIFSCILSCTLLTVRFLSCKHMKWVYLLESIFAIADILQCVPWFFGSIYSTTEDRSNSKLCTTQETMFKFGILTKCLISSIATAALSYYAISKQPLRIQKVLPISLVLVFYTIISLILNITLDGDGVACHNLHDYNIYHLKNYEYIYIFFFLVPIFFFCFLNFLSFAMTLYITSHVQEDVTLVTAIMTPHRDRVAAFTLISWIAYIPALLFFMFFLFHQVNIPLYCLTGFLVSSTGTLGSGYLLLAPWIDKTRRVNLFFFIEKLIEETEGEGEGGVKLSEISVQSSIP